MKKPYLRSLLLALSLFTLQASLFNSAGAVEDPALDRILKAHVDAMGGWRAWNKVESIRLTGTIKRDGQEVDFCIIKKRPNQIRATITMPIPDNEEEFVQLIRAHDGEKAWTATRLAGGRELNQRPLDETAALELLDDANVEPKLISVWRDGAPLKYKGIEQIGETKAHRIDTQRKDDSSKKLTFFIDTETYTLIQYSAYSTETGTTTTSLSNYTPIEDVLVPLLIKTASSRTGTTSMHVDEYLTGVGIYEDYFVTQK